MIDAVKKSMAHLVDYQIPQGGLFLWLALRRPLPTDELVKRSLEQGVSFVPGNRFLIEKSDYVHDLRLNFTYQPDEAICRGIERIGKALDSFR